MPAIGAQGIAEKAGRRPLDAAWRKEREAPCGPGCRVETQRDGRRLPVMAAGSSSRKVRV